MKATQKYRLALGIALLSSLMLLWLSLGVGIIGKDGDPANRMYFAVIAVGLIGSGLARFRPLGMARTLFAAAATQTLIAVMALVQGLGQPWSGPLELSLLNGIFLVLFLSAGVLFRSAAVR